MQVFLFSRRIFCLPPFKTFVLFKKALVFIFAEVSDQNFVSVDQEEDKESRLCREKRMKMAAAHDSNKYKVRLHVVMRWEEQIFFFSIHLSSNCKGLYNFENCFRLSHLLPLSGEFKKIAAEAGTKDTFLQNSQEIILTLITATRRGLDS